MMFRRPRMKASRGSGLVLSLIALSVLSLLATTVYKIARSLVRESVYQMRSAQAQAIAEAGLEDALMRLRNDPFRRSGFARKPFAGGSYTVRISTDPSPWVTSIGYSQPLFLLGPAVRTVRAQARFIWSADTACAVEAQDSLSVLGGSVDAYDSLSDPAANNLMPGADICSNGTLEVARGSRVSGSGRHVGAASVADGSMYGRVHTSTYAPILTLPPPIFSDDSASIAPGDCPDCPQGRYQAFVPSTRDLDVSTAGYSARLGPGSYLLRSLRADAGALEVDSDEGEVMVYLDADLVLESEGAIRNSSRSPARLALYGKPGRLISLNSRIPLHADIRAPGARVIIGPLQTVYGRISARDVEVRGTLRFDLQLGHGPPARVEWEKGTWSSDYGR